MKFTTSIFIAVLGLASGGNAAPAPIPKNMVPVPFPEDLNATSTLSVRAPVPNTDEKDAERIPFTQHDHKAICQHRALPLDVAHTYSVMTNPGLESVPDIAKTCGDLWSSLRRHSGCAASSGATCREHDDMKGVLVWHFTASSFCNVGMVGSAWWEATHNEFGQLACANVNELSFS
ncbi:uncharacterized protein ColSpa_05834 [Colletotrichum spaethianum]|uniref:Uncharacterized protein n=1 Tax=Colletotrichum spaethianum TaxID=700344 RepID=A0AA37P211_9PEZI|nr:uncharacterized protein ColSpa_05834 [Colletotrichum spaethianum]GKT45653.1 hypothetical protein ColSpa_05834 [Colletotrichum spaethianum]